MEVKKISNEEKSKLDDRIQTQEILKAISVEIPIMLKNILTEIFSEEAGKRLGKAAAAYFKELRNGGIPEETAVKLTQEYIGAFTSLADLAFPDKYKAIKKLHVSSNTEEVATKTQSKRKA
jgi:hypothetical protein